MERCCFQYQGALESLDHRQVFGDIIVLMSDPLGDLDFAYWTALDYHANTSGTWISPGIHHPHMPPTLTSFGLAHNASFASQGQESFAVRMPVNKMCKLCEKAEQVFPNVYLENLLRGRRFKRRNVRNALKSGAVGS